MIVSRAPTRITFAGGGTDIESYYCQKGGFLIAAGIDKYIWITVNRGYYDYIHLKYSGEEAVQDVAEIKHPIFREVLEYCNQRDPVEIASLSDVPVGCGLGSSSSFTVALLQVICSYQGREVDQEEIAEDACYIEISRLGEPIGKQDQYMAALGGITCLTFSKDGEVTAEPLNISEDTARKLNGNLLLFYTGVSERSSYVLTEVKQRLEKKTEVVSLLDAKKDMAFETKGLLENGKLDDWGRLLNDYWRLQRKVSSKVSNSFIDEAYKVAIKNGALGGKLQGAGAGGFLMFYCPEHKGKLRQALETMGLKEMNFTFDCEGVKSYVL